MFTVGAGTIFFTLLSKTLINPDNLPPTIVEQNESIKYLYFSAEIADRFPTMLRVVALINLASVVIFCPFLYEPEADEEQAHNSSLLMNDSF